MAARASHSASGAAASSSDDASRCLLLALSHDELGVIFDGLADPLQPVVAVTFSSTCKGLRTPPLLERARFILMERHFRAQVLCRKLGQCHHDEASDSMVDMTCLRMREAEVLRLGLGPPQDEEFVVPATLGMIMRTNGLPRLQRLVLYNNYFGDEGAEALFEGLGPGSLPSLVELDLECNNLGPAGAEVLAAALRRGAMPNLETLDLCINTLGNQGFAALAPQIRKLPALSRLAVNSCGLNDTDVASLFGNLGKDEFKALARADLEENLLTNKGCAALVEAVKAGAMPCLGLMIFDADNPFNDVVEGALAARKQ